MSLARFLQMRCWLVPFVFLFGTALLTGARVAADDAGDSAAATSFTPAQRKLIDEGALWGPREKRNVSRVEAYGNALKWLVARTPLPVEEEVRRATEKDEELRQKTRTAPAPAAAQQVLERLI